MKRRNQFLLVLSYSLAIHDWRLILSSDGVSIIIGPCGQDVISPKFKGEHVQGSSSGMAALAHLKIYLCQL